MVLMSAANAETVLPGSAPQPNESGFDKRSHSLSRSASSPSPTFLLSSHHALSVNSPDHLYLPITLSFPNRTSVQTYALVDSGATRSFISQPFLFRHNLPRRSLPSPLTAYAVDGRTLSSGPVTHECITSLKIKSHSENIGLLVVQCPYPVILGIDWLRRHNPSIDWARSQLSLSCCAPTSTHPLSIFGTGSGHIHTPPPPPSACTAAASVGLGLGRSNCLHSRRSQASDANVKLRSSQPQPPTPELVVPAGAYLNLISRTAPTLHRNPFPLPTGSGLKQFLAPRSPPLPTFNIKLVGTKKFNAIAKTEGSMAMLLYVPQESVTVASAFVPSSSDTPARDVPDSPINKPPDLDESLKQKVAPEYHDFLDVFSDIDVQTIPPHRNDYDMKIDLEDGAKPPFGPLYSLSPAEREALTKYLDENLRKGFIRRSTSSAASPILFVKKRRLPLP